VFNVADRHVMATGSFYYVSNAVLLQSYSPLKNVQTSFGVHPMDSAGKVGGGGVKGGFYTGGNRPPREAGHSSPSSVGVKNAIVACSGSALPSPSQKRIVGKERSVDAETPAEVHAVWNEICKDCYELMWAEDILCYLEVIP
jgi:hypothetical protein